MFKELWQRKIFFFLHKSQPSPTVCLESVNQRNPNFLSHFPFGSFSKWLFPLLLRFMLFCPPAAPNHLFNRLQPSRLSDHHHQCNTKNGTCCYAVTSSTCPFRDSPRPHPQTHTHTPSHNPRSVPLCFFQIRTCFHFHPVAEPSSHSPVR